MTTVNIVTALGGLWLLGVDVVPIRAADVQAAAQFLHTFLNERVSTEHWARAMVPPWQVEAPNHGFALRGPDHEVCGVLLAFYSERVVGGSVERFCNLGAWCVLPTHRRHSLRLLRAALAQQPYTFTDLSPSGPVVPLNKRLGFEILDSTTFIVPCVPRPLSLGRTRIVEDHDRIAAALTGADMRIFADHRSAAAAHHVLLSRPEGDCYVMYRRDRRRGLPVFASVLHVSDPVGFAGGSAALASHLLFKHGVLGLLVEQRIAGTPRRSIQLSKSRPKMFRSGTLSAASVDNLYSELCCVAW